MVIKDLLHYVFSGPIRALCKALAFIMAMLVVESKEWRQWEWSVTLQYITRWKSLVGTG